MPDQMVWVWDFDRQHKDSYDDWITAFEAAIRKRAVPGCFLGLSSGYDSGAIACELLRQNVPFKAYLYCGMENLPVLQARAALVPDFQWFEPDPRTVDHLREYADNEKYTIFYDGKETDMHLLDDGGVFGVATISKLALAEDRRVSLSGQGGDEILSDYSLYPRQSELRGVFPEHLRKWRNFDRGCQESYLMKEEYAAGAYSIETRYPYLDRLLVQEFLWLTAEAKNRYYKAPLREYLKRHRFPFAENEKRGFSVYL